MRTKVFHAPALHLSVFRAGDGSLAWKGTYKGRPIRSVVPVDGECVIMLDPDASKDRVFQNLLRIGCDGEPRWVAELPADPDAFMDVHSEHDSLIAGTWSGFRMRIDPESGRTLQQEFVK